MQFVKKLQNLQLDIGKISDCLFEVLLYATCLFPFTMWIPTWYTGTDSQPYALGISIVIVAYYMFVRRKLSLPKEVIIICFLVLLIGIYAITDSITLGLLYVAKRYVTYVSIAIIPIAFFYVTRARGRIWEAMIKLSIWIWFGVGLIQRFVDSDFAARFVIRQSTDAERGLVSLAPEPSAYGYYCLFLLLFVMRFQKRKVIYIILVLVQILAMAQSTVTLVYLGIYLVGYVINSILRGKKRTLLIYVMALFGGSIMLFVAYMKHWLPGRMYQIVQMVIAGDWSSLLKDGSIAKRIEGIILAMLQFCQNLAIPQGFVGERYFSGNGILLVEGGFLSIIILGAIISLVWKVYPKNQRFAYAFGFLIVMYSAIPYSCPIVCMYLGYCCYMYEQQINIVQMLQFIWHKWKYVLVLIIGLTILSGGIRYVGEYRIHYQEYQSAIDKYNGINPERERLESKLSEEELAEVESCFEAWEAIILTDEYMQKSLLMQADPYQIPTIQLVFNVDENLVAEQVETLNELMERQEVLDELQEKTGWSIGAAYMKELISITDRDNQVVAIIRADTRENSRTLSKALQGILCKEFGEATIIETVETDTNLLKQMDQLNDNKETATHILNRYEVSFNNVQKKLAQMIVDEYMAESEKSGELLALEPELIPTKIDLSLILFSILMGITGSVVCVGCYYICKK